jgi:hypothetical protein
MKTLNKELTEKSQALADQISREVLNRIHTQSFTLEQALDDDLIKSFYEETKKRLLSNLSVKN